MRTKLVLVLACLSLSAAANARPPDTCTAAALAADIKACDSLIATEPDSPAKANMLAQRAYAWNERQKYEEALKDLDQALTLEPDNGYALMERGFTLNALGEYERALADLDKEAALRPDSAAVYSERAFARHHLADLAGAYADRVEVVSRARSAESLLARAEAAMWIGLFDEAVADIDAAEALARPAGDEKVLKDARDYREAMALLKAGRRDSSAAKRCDSAQKKGRFDQPDLIGDCTFAFFEAPTPAAAAGFLTTRSMAWLIGRQDVQSSTADIQIASALDPGNADWHSNLGYAYLRVRHSWAARREFDRALAIKKSWVALAGRASAKYNLGDKDGAFADAKASFEIESNALALIVIGDLFNDDGDKASAKKMWMSAYRTGTRDDGLIERLRSIGVEHPEREAK